jgi:hypothetical protein
VERRTIINCCRTARQFYLQLPHVSTLPIARPTVVWTALPDGAVLFSTETEVYYSINTVGALVWELLPSDGMTLDALCDVVREHFPGAPLAQIRGDVVELLADLERCGLVDAPVG